MDFTLESKACAACAKAKRRCGKQIPACSRCESRGISCEYPPVKSFCLPPRQYGESQTPRRQTGTSVLETALDTSISDTFFNLSGEAMAVDDIFALNFDTTAIPRSLSVVDLNPRRPCLPWYLEPSSWEIDHMAPTAYTTPFCHSVLMNHIEHIQDWQARWLNTGSNPYIHKHVYKFQHPRCMQDAYTMLSAYIHRTPENKGVIEVLLEERIRQLRRDQPPAGEEDAPDAHQSLSTFEHMARVHALHTYQTICLFDGAIRMRHVAETLIPTLNLWLRQLMASAKASASQGPDAFVHSLLLPRDQQHQQHQQQQQQAPHAPAAAATTADPELVVNQYVPTLTAASAGPEDTAWYAWAFAETIRRTWGVACATQTIYLALQLRWAPCPGGTKSTTRGGLWEADTAFAWAEAAAEAAGGRGGGGGGCGGGCGGDGLDFVSRGSWEEILERRTPDDVDEYMLTSLQLCFGLERVARWKARVAPSG